MDAFQQRLEESEAGGPLQQLTEDDVFQYLIGDLVDVTTQPTTAIPFENNQQKTGLLYLERTYSKKNGNTKPFLTITTDPIYLVLKSTPHLPNCPTSSS